MAKKTAASPDDSGSRAEKVAFHASGPLLRKLLALQEQENTAGRPTSLGMIAKRLILAAPTEGSASGAASAPHPAQEQIDELKFTVDSLRLELRSLAAEVSPNRLLPIVQELRDDVATAIRAALVIVGKADDAAVERVMEHAFPRGGNGKLQPDEDGEAP